jgi:hypothetical protein
MINHIKLTDDLMTLIQLLVTNGVTGSEDISGRSFQFGVAFASFSFVYV